jgi:hypothetical protein
MGGTGPARFVPEQPDELLATASGTNVDCFGNATGTASVSVTGGTIDYSYAWSNGGTTASIGNLIAGTYTVTVTDSLGCSGSASYKVYYYAGSFVFLGNDTAFCNGDSVTLDAGIFPTYLWQDGTTNSKITVSQPGTYYVTILDFNNCIISDTIVIDPFYPDPPANLVADTTICGTEIVTIDGPPGYVSYEWSTGSTSNFLDVTEPGAYSLTVTNDHACSTTDPFTVTTLCPTGLFIPNAFTPNNDGLNDIYVCNGVNKDVTNLDFLDFFARKFSICYFSPS